MSNDMKSRTLEIKKIEEKINNDKIEELEDL